ncbi:shikimate dehydrogenase [Candidatus Peregrinibacteria bacterium]|nr:shikimate dehydrogenase [Candidatus Peregrinibacteria bacterium]
MTDIYGILAYPASHSLSPLLQNAAFEMLDIDAKYDFFEIPPAELSAFMQRVRNEPIRGLSVSLPYKESILKYLDEVDSTARDIGAVNTILNENGILKGYNTDTDAAIESLEEITPVSGKHIVVLGAGGAARAIVYGLTKKHAKVTILNRTQEKAQKLAEAFFCDFGRLDQLKNLKADILIQTTNVGMNFDCVIDSFYFKQAPRHLVVFDIIYAPRETKLIQEAVKAGLKVVTGDRMFLRQAMRQFEIWTKQKAPFHIMERLMRI